MKVLELIQVLQNAINHGQNPDAEIMAWDPDVERWEPVSTVSLSETDIRLYTDDPN